MTPTNLSAALELARLGLRVHPLRPGDKVPLLKDWPARASANETQVRSFWREHPRANVGIACGGGLLVLDVDVERGGEESLRALLKQHGALPRTVTVRTGGGGWHYYLRVPADAALKNSANRLGAGLDIRTDGGQVAAPPSRHPSGNRYAWAKGFGPADIPVADAPEWLLALLREPVRQVPPAAPRSPAERSTAYERARRYLATMPPAVSGSGGHAATFKAALALVRGFCLSEADALELLANEYNPRCEPPWTDRELQHKVASAAKDGSLPSGYLLDAPPPERAPRVARAPEPPPPSDDDAPPQAARVYALRTTPPAAYTASAKTDGTAALASAEAPPAPSGGIPLTKSYASLCQILRTPSLRRLVLGEGELEYNEQTLEPCIGRRPILDADLAAIRERAELNFTWKKKGIQFPAGDIKQAVLQVAQERRFHPVAEYLTALRWDGIRRLDHIAEDILQIPASEANALTVAMLRKWMIAAVARALRPGCKVDNVLVLVGPQGIWKSRFFRELTGTHWFSDTSVNLHDKDSKLLLRRVWVLEWAELDSMHRAGNANSVKGFITSQVDHVRPPYGATIAEFPRTCIIVGTTNESKFLTDSTGNRRFWPVTVRHQVNIEALKQQREQLWAEAVAAFNDGEQWWLDTDEDRELAQMQEQFERRDVWEHAIELYMQHADAPTMAEILEKGLGKPVFQATKNDEQRAAAILHRLGYEHRRKMIAGKQAWRWVKRAEQMSLGEGT